MNLPPRLHHLRTLHGWSEAHLFQRAGLSPSEAQAWLDAGAPTDSRAASVLASALGIPRAFLATALRLPPPEALHLNPPRTISATQVQQALSRALLTMEWLDLVAERVTLKWPDLPHDLLSSADPHRTEALPLSAIEATANALRSWWKLGNAPIRQLLAHIEGRGIWPIVQAGSKVPPFSVVQEGRAAIVASDEDRRDGRKWRQTLAVQLGHLVLHATRPPLSDDDREQEARDFAGALLMPRETFAPDSAEVHGYHGLPRLSERWGAPIMAVVDRMRAMGDRGPDHMDRISLGALFQGWHVIPPGVSQWAAEELTVIPGVVDRLRSRGWSSEDLHGEWPAGDHLLSEAIGAENVQRWTQGRAAPQVEGQHLRLVEP